MGIDGILNINKPAGETSLDTVKRVRRLSAQRWVGHAGTLDPEATGVLPVCVGQATRIIPFIVDARKTYLAEMVLGVTTDTYDAEGTVTGRADPFHVAREQFERALPSFLGSILQQPPMYSAVKHQGKRLYELARAGIEVEREPRPAEVFRLELLDWRPPACTIEIECGKGTYVRSLVHDLGQALGCGAHVKRLVRTRNGLFDIRDSITIPQLEAAFQRDEWRELLHPMDAVLEHWMAAIVSEEQETHIRHGRPVALAIGEEQVYCRAYSVDGRFLAVLRFVPERSLWHPEKVFATA